MRKDLVCHLLRRTREIIPVGAVVTQRTIRIEFSPDNMQMLWKKKKMHLLMLKKEKKMVEISHLRKDLCQQE